MREQPSGRPSARFAAIVLAVLTAPVAAGMPPAPFTEEAVQRGVTFVTTSTPAYGFGVAFADLDGDGDPDLVAVGRTNHQVGVFENDGSGQFTELGPSTMIRSHEHASGVSAADFDGDGDLDLLITNWHEPDTLLRNDGGFVFTEVAGLTGMADASAPGTASAWGDYDDDGWLDLFVGVRTSSEGSTAENSVFRNQGDGTLADVTNALGLAGDGVTFQGVWFDYDRDGDVDLYVSNDKCPTTGVANRLWRNDGATFTELAGAAGAAACIDSMGVAAGDFDGNLAPDLYVTNIQNGNRLMMNQGDSTFANATNTADVASFAYGWCAMFADVDNDGHRELFVCNLNDANRLYKHDGSWPATDEAVAYDLTGLPGEMAYGGAFADIDLDGDLDLAVINSPGWLRLYVNHEGESRRWLRVRLVGRRNNLHAIGAEVEITAGGRTQVAQLMAGTNYKSQDELVLHFGLDDATSADEVRVVWPGGSPTRVLSGLSADRVWTIYPPERLGDADGDGDRDLADFVVFASCVDDQTDAAPGCEMMDFDGDGRVAAEEIDTFLAQFDGTPADCNGNGHPDMREIVLGIAQDLDGTGVPDACETAGDAAGRLDGGSALTVGRGAGQLQLGWSGDCGGSIVDHAIYGGQLGGFSDRTTVTCSTAGGSGWSLDESTAPEWFVVVPRSSDREGSYGRDGAGVERLPAPGACLPQAIAVCP